MPIRIKSSAGVLVVLLWLNILCFSMAQAAEPPQNWGEKQGDDIPVLDTAQEQRLDEMQEKASATLMDVANWIDSFFDDGRAIEEENTTRATIKLSLGYSRNDNFEIKPRFDWRLKLPALTSRAHIFIQASDDEDFDVESDPITSRPANEESDNSQLTAGIKWFLKESDKFNVSVDTGMSWDYLFAGLRFRSIQQYGDEWLGRFTNRLRYYTDDGLENKMSYDFENQISTRMLFRTTTSINWYEGEDGFPHSQYFRLYQVLSEHQALSYESGVYLDTEPSYKMTDLQFILKYRQRFFRDWLTLEISPRVTFPEDHDYEANPGIIFKLEASIGYRPGEAGYGKIFR